jgi:multidrug resistance efflux pump
MPESDSLNATVEPSTSNRETEDEGRYKSAQNAAVAPMAKRPLWVWVVIGVAIVLFLILSVPWVINAFRTVSTDDAYVSMTT